MSINLWAKNKIFTFDGNEERNEWSLRFHVNFFVVDLGVELRGIVYVLRKQ